MKTKMKRIMTRRRLFTSLSLKVITLPVDGCMLNMLTNLDDDDVDMPGMPWDNDGWGPPRHDHGLHRAHVHHHRHHHHGNNPWHLFEPGHPRDGGFVPPYRTHRSAVQQRANDDGLNPLLRRGPG